MVIFHSYVSLPDSTLLIRSPEIFDFPSPIPIGAAPSGTSGGRSSPATPAVSRGRHCLVPGMPQGSSPKTWKNLWKTLLGQKNVKKNRKKLWLTNFCLCFCNFKNWTTDFSSASKITFLAVAQTQSDIFQVFIG